jgi:hypothetical protein
LAIGNISGKAGNGRRDPLIDIDTGRMLEFSNGMIEPLPHKAANQLGYGLVQYRLEVFAANLKTGRSPRVPASRLLRVRNAP